MAKTQSAALAAGVACMLVACLMPTTIHAVGSTNAWNQIHHDARNSGRVPWTANLRNGKCPAWTAFPNQTYGTEIIQANGAMGVTGDYVFYVGNAPGAYVIHQVNTITGEQVKQTANTFKDMDSSAVGSVAVGIIPIFPPDADGASPDDNGLDDVFYSFGAEVYSLLPQWHWTAPNPVYAPLRLSHDGGLLLVTASNATADANGSLHALDTSTGKERWNFTTFDGMKSWGMRISPAITEDGLVYACYGQTMVMLNATNGEVVSQTSTLPLLSVLGSSPTVTQDGTKVFVQSKSDDVWRFDVVTDADGKPSLQQMYVCLYSILVPDCVWLNTTEALNPDELSPHFRAQLLGPKPEAGAPLKPGLQPRHYKSDGTPVIDLGDDNRATVALGPNDESIIFPLYTTEAGLGGVHSASTTDGSRNWRYLSTEDSQYLGDMMGRSSPAVDAAGYVFVGMDQVDQGQSGVPPVLLALDNNGNRLWVDGGLAPGPIWNPIGLRSPMLGYASTETSIASKVFFARTGIVQAFGPGQTCPSTNPLFSCSGHGSCNCLAGTCRCEVLTCFYGDDCGTEQLCNENGFCMQGECDCTSLCFSGPTCSTPNTCSDRGTCGDSGCQCDSACYYGQDCEYVKDCSGQGECQLDTGVCKCHEGLTGPDCQKRIITTGPSPGLGGGWVFIIVTLCLFTVATGAYMGYWKRRSGEWWFWKWRVSEIAAGCAACSARLCRRSGTAGEAQPLTGASPARRVAPPKGGGYTADL